MKRAIQKGYRFVADIAEYFQYGWKSNLFPLYVKGFSSQLIFSLNKFRHNLFTKGNNVKHLEDEKVKRLKKVAEGLHSLLPFNPLYSYSVLIPIFQPNPIFLKKALLSVLNQTAPSLEVLIGFNHPLSESVQDVLHQLNELYPFRIKTVQVENTEDFILNRLAEEATGHFLFTMGQEDWIRPDLFFRYEQTLRVLSNPESTVLYCDENRVNELDYIIPTTETRKEPLHFPYFFNYLTSQALLIPKLLWQKTRGLRQEYRGAEYEDLALRLELAGAQFQLIPLTLYSKRMIKSKANKFKHNRDIFLKALTDYATTKKLDWKWVAGYGHQNVRAIPPLNLSHSVQIIIPFKDQKELTLSCIKHVLKQKEVNYKITAIDNRSADESIAQELQELGVEVLKIDEPFNYSRLNNLAVKQTQTAADCTLLLFLNNDVDLKEDALAEMVRWIDQPEIGMVGCRLHYPDGRLQHGGVRLDYYPMPHQMHWEHLEKFQHFEELEIAKRLGVMHAVTAACALIKREIFLKAGGFDEIWYPIAYSDTNLAIKLDLMKLKCFYTPYAVGTHHESVSRKDGIEDYENSKWLHQFLLKNHYQHTTNFFH